MADPQYLPVKKWARFMLPYGWVLAFYGSGHVVNVVRGVTTKFSAVGVRQTIGPFKYDADCDLSSSGDLYFEKFNLAEITQADLDGLTSLPIGTQAVVIVGGVRVEKYWSGSAWVVESGGGAGASDSRKLATWFAKLATGAAKCVFSGDSTTEQMGSLNFIPFEGRAPLLSSQYPSLSVVSYENRGKTGALMQGFVQPGAGDPNMGGLDANLDAVAEAAGDLVILCWGLNDARGALTPGQGGNPDWRSSYGSAGQVATALLFQSWMQEMVTRIRAVNPDAAIIFCMPNALNVGSVFMLSSVTPQQCMDVLRLTYRGDPALSVPSPETFADGVLVFDSMATVFDETAYPQANELIESDNDGFHPTAVGYRTRLQLLGALMEGPALASLGSAQIASAAAAREKVIAGGWQAGKESIDAILKSGEYRRVYALEIAANNGSYCDVNYGPTASSGAHAWGGAIGEDFGSESEPGICVDDAIVWTFSDGSRVLKRVVNPGDANIGAIRYFNGSDISGDALPSSIVAGTQGAVYRHMYGHSPMARRNALSRFSGTPEQVQLSYPNQVLFAVVSAANGSVVVRGIGGEFDSLGDTASTHTWTTSDVMCLAGVEGMLDGVEDYFGILLTDATFGVDGLEVTITLAGFDFRQFIGRQGVLLHGAAA